MTTDHAHEREHVQWRLLHSYVVDAVLNQDDDDISRAIQIIFGGMRLRDFGRAVEDGSRVRVRPLREDDGTVAIRVEVLGDDDAWHGLVRPPARVLGIADDEAQAALEAWFDHYPDSDLPQDPEHHQ